MTGTMFDKLHQRFVSLRRRTRQAILLRGISWIVVYAFTSLLLAGFTDWGWHIGSNLRLAFGLTILLGSGLLAWRLLVRPLMHPLSDLDLALKVEKRFPLLKDGLASTVQFANEKTDSTFGSPAFQQRVITETLPQIDRLDLDDVIESRTVRTATSTAIGVSLAVLLIVGWNQPVAGMAMNRLIFPYSAGDWKRNTELRLLDDQLETISHEQEQPLRRVQGDMLKVYIENIKGELPKDVALEVETPDGDVVREKLRQIPVRDRSGSVRRLATANIFLDQGPIHFRAIGGDNADRRWHRLDVVHAPQLKTIRVTLIPPKYTGRKQETLPRGLGHIEALVGTEIRIEATANTPLKYAKLRLKAEKPRNLKIQKDGKRFHATFRLREAGTYSYGFDLKDHQGFENPNSPRYDIRALRDRLPTVRIIKPARNLHVTKNGVVPVKLLVEDDIRLRDIRLRHRSSETPNGPFQTTPLMLPVREFRWQMKGVTVGMQVRFFAEATDDFNLDQNGRETTSMKPTHIGKSLTRTLTIVTPQDKVSDISRDYISQLKELVRVVKLQQQARDNVAQLILQLKKTNLLRPKEDLPILRRVERDQHEVTTRLSKARSVESKTRELVEEIKNNRLHEPGVLQPKERKNLLILRHRLERIIVELSTLRKFHLAKIETALTLTRKNADDDIFNARQRSKQSSVPTPQQQRQKLQSVQIGQDTVLTTLKELIVELRQWRDWRELLTEITELIQTQDTLNNQIISLKSRTLGLPISELTNQQNADLARSAESQKRIAQRLTQFRTDINRINAAMMEGNSNSPAVMNILAEADQFLQSRTLPSQMGDTSKQIENNQLGRVATSQKVFLADLRELKTILENRGESDLETLIKKQKNTERALANLFAQQQQLDKQSETAAKITNANQQREELLKLSRKQDILRNELEQTASILRKLLAIAANNSARRASETMQRATKHLEKTESQPARIEQLETLSHLEQARIELAKTRAANETQLAREMLEHISDELRGLVKRQQNVIKGTERLHKEYEKTRRWSRGKLMTLDTLQEEQLSLHGKLADIAQKAQAAVVFTRVLETVGTRMQQAALQLTNARENFKFLLIALEEERSAEQRLISLLKTLSPEPRISNPNPKANTGAVGSPGSQNSGISRLAQWKLLKSLQADMLLNTDKLHKLRTAGSPVSATLKKQTEQLADEQGNLADIARKIIESNTRKIPAANQQNNSNLAFQIKQPTKPDGSSKTKSLSVQELQQNIITSMRASATQLDKQQTGNPAQNPQKQAIQDLETLIKLAEQLQANSKKKVQPSVPANGNKTQKKSGKKPNNKQPSTKSPSSKNGKKKPIKSDSGIRNPGKVTKKQQITRRRSVISDFWGHLPESEKQRLRNINGENYLPKYKSLINRYFESLAEDK